MINLLAPDTKSTYRYARRNRILLRWVMAIGSSLLLAVALIGGGYVYLNQQINSTQKLIDTTNEQLRKQNLPAVQKQVTDISNNLKLAVDVLSKEILFSELLKQLAQIMPSSAVLTNLTISDAQAGVDITAQTTDYAAATQLQVNLADPKNKIFSKADIVGINCTSTSGVSTSYPCTATIRALFSTNNPFLFINSGAKK